MMNITTGKYLFTLILLTATLLTARYSHAATAANTRIVNTATVTYNSGRTVSASVTVTVALVPATPNISISSDLAAYSSPNSPAISNAITITATANGPAEYTVTPSITATSNVSGANPASVNIDNNPQAAITVGATVTSGVSGQTFVTVPAGSSSGDNSPVNGIGSGATIVFSVNGNTYARIVTSTSHDVASGTYRINWLEAIPAVDVPTGGTLVAEQKSIIATVLPGAVQTVGRPITVTVQAIVSTSGTADALAVAAQANTWTTKISGTSLGQFVRNVTAASGSGAPYIYNSVNYYVSGVTAKPGDVLEYLLVSTNNDSNAVTESAVTDILPAGFTSFKYGAYGPGRDVTYVSDSNSVAYFTTTADGDQASFDAASGELKVFLGSGATGSAGGSIPGNNKSVFVLYQVTVNN